MKKLFLRAEFGPLWEPWEVDEIGRKTIQIAPKKIQIDRVTGPLTGVGTSPAPDF